METALSSLILIALERVRSPLRFFWHTQLGLPDKTGCSHFRALPDGVRRAVRRYRACASVTSLATYRTNAMRPVSSSQ